jgi:phosphinothricin tripeptide acetyl hydrolase
MRLVLDLLDGLGLATDVHSIEERRSMMEADGVGEVAERTCVEPVVAAGVAGEWVADVAAAPPDSGVVVHLHGGAYTSGSLATHRRFAGTLSELAGLPVLLVDYRLAPEHPFPAALDDATAVLGWLTGERGVDPARVVLSGDSAGGGLALSALVAWRDAGGAALAGGVLLSPWTDLTFSGDSMTGEEGRDPMCSRASLAPSVDAYLGGGVAADDPRVSPLFADLAGLPPLLVHVGEVETLRDDAVRLAERARAAGTDVELLVAPGMVHVWHLFAGMAPESDAALADVARWVRLRIGG